MNPEIVEHGAAGRGDGLSRTEPAELFKRVQESGDLQAREELVRRFLPLARKLAGRYTNPYEPFEDLVQVASVGLLGAIDRFDPSRGVEFQSFAVPTILGELKRYFRGTGWSAHVPRRAQEFALKVDKAVREISATTGEAPAVADLARYLELSTEDVLIGLDASQAHYSLSLDAPPRQADGHSKADPFLDGLGREDQGFGLIETMVSLGAALEQLPRLESEALTLRLTGDLKQIEIAERLGCSQMQVSRLLRRAAAHVRDLMEGEQQ